MRNKLRFLCIACMEKRKSGYKSILGPSNLPYTFPFLQKRNEEKSHTVSPQSKQMLHNSQFLQTLSCQKTYMDKARLSSLVNKHVDTDGAGCNIMRQTQCLNLTLSSFVFLHPLFLQTSPRVTLVGIF